MDKHRAPVSVDRSKCVPCSGLICVGVCPQGVLEPGPDKKPKVADADSCTQCGVCVNLCPAKAIATNKPSKGDVSERV